MQAILGGQEQRYFIDQPLLQRLLELVAAAAPAPQRLQPSASAKQLARVGSVAAAGGERSFSYQQQQPPGLGRGASAVAAKAAGAVAEGVAEGVRLSDGVGGADLLLHVTAAPEGMEMDIAEDAGVSEPADL